MTFSSRHSRYFPSYFFPEFNLAIFLSNIHSYPQQKQQLHRLLWIGKYGNCFIQNPIMFNSQRSFWFDAFSIIMRDNIYEIVAFHAPKITMTPWLNVFVIESQMFFKSSTKAERQINFNWMAEKQANRFNCFNFSKDFSVCSANLESKNFRSFTWSFLSFTTRLRCLPSTLSQIFASFFAVFKHLMANICLSSDFSSSKQFFVFFEHLLRISMRENVHVNFSKNNFSMWMCFDMRNFPITSHKNVNKFKKLETFCRKTIAMSQRAYGIDNSKMRKTKCDKVFFVSLRV